MDLFSDVRWFIDGVIEAVSRLVVLAVAGEYAALLEELLGWALVAFLLWLVNRWDGWWALGLDD